MIPRPDRAAPLLGPGVQPLPVQAFVLEASVEARRAASCGLAAPAGPRRVATVAPGACPSPRRPPAASPTGPFRCFTRGVR